IPLPSETLLRVQLSPVPTQTFFAFFGSSVIAPIDCTGCSSNTGLKRVPLSSDFQTPPLAEPTKIVSLPFGSLIASIAATRPLIAAEPTLRAPRPEIVDELNGAGVGSAAKTAPAKLAARMSEDLEKRMGFTYLEAVAGNLKIVS